MAQSNEFDNFDQISRRLQCAGQLPFSVLLPGERVAGALAQLSLKFRERLYPPVATLWMFLSQTLSPDHSCQDAVNRMLAWRAARGLTPGSAETTSYCEARKKLPLVLIQQLSDDVARQLEQEADSTWLWNGRHVKIVDGSTVTMADTPANQAAYPQSTNQRPGCGFPILRLLVLFSLASGAALTMAMAAIRGKKTGESTLFQGLLSALSGGDVLLADRLFASYRVLAACLAKGIDVVARQHATRRTDFRRGRWLGTLDHLVTWTRPKFDAERFTRAQWEALPETMRVRELRFMVSGLGFRSHAITLVTTLLDAQSYPAAEVAALYRERWHCELDLRSLKRSLQMGHLHCKTPAMVEKEVWMHVLAYNLIRQVAARAAREHQRLPRRLSFQGTVQTINAFAVYFSTCPQRRGQLWSVLLQTIATLKVGHRPNRVEPRKLKRRIQKYTYLTRPRWQEKQTLRA